MLDQLYNGLAPPLSRVALKYALVSKFHPRDLEEIALLQRLNSIIERRLCRDWTLLIRFEEDLRCYSFGLCVELKEGTSEGSLVGLSLGPSEVRVLLPWREIVLSNPSVETLIPLDISIISTSLFQDPQFVMNEGLVSKALFYTNPSIWSDPLLVGPSISSTYRRLSEELGLERRYYSFARALQFLSGIDHLPEFMEAFKALSSMGISPPITKTELLHTPDLSPTEMKVLRVLCVKEAIDRVPTLTERQVTSLLSDLAGIPSGPQRARVQKSLSGRGLKEGLTLTELALTVGVDKAYLWRYVIPSMVDGCLIRVGKDTSKGKEVKVYRPNPYVTFVNDLIMTYSTRISHLLSRRVL